MTIHPREYSVTSEMGFFQWTFLRIPDNWTPKSRHVECSGNPQERHKNKFWSTYRLALLMQLRKLSWKLHFSFFSSCQGIKKYDCFIIFIADFFSFLFSTNTKHHFISGLEHWELIKSKISVSSIPSLLSTAICIDVVITIPAHAFFCAGEIWAPSLLGQSPITEPQRHTIHPMLQQRIWIMEMCTLPKQRHGSSELYWMWSWSSLSLRGLENYPCLPGARDIYSYFVLLVRGEVRKGAYHVVSSFLWFYCCDNRMG